MNVQCCLRWLAMVVLVGASFACFGDERPEEEGFRGGGAVGEGEGEEEPLPDIPPADPEADEGAEEGGRGHTPDDEDPGEVLDPSAEGMTCHPGEILDFQVDAVVGEDGTKALLAASGSKSVVDGSCGGEGGEVAIRFTTPDTGLWRFDTLHDQTDYDTLIHLRSDCADPDTELACNDDIMRRRMPWSLVEVQLDAGEVVFVLVDGYSPRDEGTFVLTARQIEVIEEGGACDPLRRTNVCVNDGFCFFEGEIRFGDPQVPDGECRAATAPVLLSASGISDEGRVLLEISGTDGSRDVVGIRLELLRDGRAIPLGWRGGTTTTARFDESVRGLAEFTGVIDLDGGAGLEGVDIARVRLIDSQQLLSELMEVELAEVPEIGPLGRCDPKGRASKCVEGAECLVPTRGPDDPEPEHGICGVASPPTLQAVEGFLNPVTNGLGIRASGEDTDYDIASARVWLLDAEGGAIPYTPDGLPPAIGQPTYLDIPAAWIERVEAGFIATFVSPIPRSIPGIARVRVEVVDRQGLRSEAVEGELTPTPPVAEGEDCDVVTALNACPDGLLCAEGDCTEALAACPEEWELIELHRFEQAQRMVHSGDTSGSPEVEPGTCGGGSGPDVLVLTAPEGGTYTIETALPGRFSDSVLYVRSHCRYPGPAAELACNDDVDGEGGLLGSRVGLALEEGQTVYVFVDGWGGEGGWRGAYSLIVTWE
jgi:hypothetical protein